MHLHLIFSYKYKASGEVFQLVFVQKYEFSTQAFSSQQTVDELGCGTWFGLPKLVLGNQYVLYPTHQVVGPVCLIPDFEIEQTQGRQEYFVRYNIDMSSLVDKVYEKNCSEQKEKVGVSSHWNKFINHIFIYIFSSVLMVLA